MLLDRGTRGLFTKMIVIPKQLMQYFVEPLEFKLKVSDGGVQSYCLKVFCRYIKMQIYFKKCIIVQNFMGQTLCRNTPVTSISAWMSVHELAALCAHSVEETRLLVVVIYTFLPAADINVRNSIVIMPFLHSPPSLLFS